MEEKKIIATSINHPSHYNSGRIEVIEAIEDWKLNFHRGNAVKYIARAGKKIPDKEVEDLEKAIWYLKREIEVLKATSESRLPIKPNEMSAQVICECPLRKLSAEGCHAAKSENRGFLPLAGEKCDCLCHLHSVFMKGLKDEKKEPDFKKSSSSSQA